MKRGTVRHPKTLALADALHVAPWAAVGLLDVLLDWAFDYVRDGAIGKYPDHAIARGIGWEGNCTELVDVLVRTGWLERCAVHRLVIHDLADHVSDTWRTMMRRQGREFATVTPVESDESLTSTGRIPDESLTNPVPVSDQSVPPTHAYSRHVTSTDLRETGKRSVSLRSASKRALAIVDPPGFVLWWTVYPRKVARAAAVKAWQQAFGTSEPPIARMVDAIAWQKQSAAWLEGNGKFIPHPATYLHGRRWEDEPTQTPGAFADPRTSGNAQVLAEVLAELDERTHA